MRCLWLITGALLLSSFTANALHYADGPRVKPFFIRLFDVDSERNFPTFFSVALLLGAAGFLGLITLCKRAVRDRFTVQWGCLAAGFCYLGLDEFSLLHEQLDEPMKSLLSAYPLSPRTWIIPGAFAALTVAMMYMPFLRHLEPAIRRQFILSGSIYLGGALGLDLIGRAFRFVRGDGLAYSAFTHLEEGMEMSGIIMFWGVLMTYYASLSAPVSIAVEAPQPLPAKVASGQSTPPIPEGVASEPVA